MTIEKPQGSDAPALSYPRLKGGNPIIISCPMSEEQHALHKDLVARYERLHPIAVGEPATQEDLDTWYELLRSGKVDPREPLAIATDHRKLALDSRLLSVTATDFPGSKINASESTLPAT